MDKTEIINLTEASGVSDNDYVMVDSPTQGVRKYLVKNFSGGSGSRAIYLTQAEYDILTPEEKADGNIYFVEASESDWVFVATSENGAWKYSAVPETAKYLLAVTSLNNVCYAGIHYTVAGQAARVLTTQEQSAIATKLGMSSTYASSQTIGGSGTSQAVNSWRDGSNQDKVHISESSLSNVGTKTDYEGCKAHLFYKTGGARKIYFNNELWSEIIL